MAATGPDGGDAWVATVQIADIDPDYPVRVDVEGVPIALCRVGEEVFAINDICSHAYAHLSDGFVEGGEIFCPLHQGSFCLKTGEAVAAPCFEPIETYGTRIDGGVVHVSASSVLQQKAKRRIEAPG